MTQASTIILVWAKDSTGEWISVKSEGNSTRIIRPEDPNIFASLRDACQRAGKPQAVNLEPDKPIRKRAKRKAPAPTLADLGL